MKREQIRRAVPCPTTALVELTVKLYLRDGAEAVHDIDNRLKDVMDALQALKDLRSVTQVGVSYQEYRSRLADTKIKVIRFLEGPDTASDAGLHVVDAMAYFEQAALTWQGDIGGLRNALGDAVSARERRGLAPSNERRTL